MNEVLHSVINRGAGFATPSFPSHTDFVPDTNEVAQSVRAYLGLTRTDTDYFVVGALQILRAYPDLLCRFGEKQRNYTLGIYKPNPPQCSPARLVTRDSVAPFVRRRPQEWPPVFDTKITLVDVDTLDLLQDTTTRLNYTRSGETLLVPWSVACGIGGALWCPDWTGVREIHVRADPYGYPYTLLAEQLILRDDVQAVLEQSDAWVSFVDTPSAPRKIALLLAALGLQNKAVYGTR